MAIGAPVTLIGPQVHDIGPNTLLAAMLVRHHPARDARSRPQDIRPVE
jgi:hypothetical protein